MAKVYLALGSNLHNPVQQVNDALLALSRLPLTERLATSDFYRTPPYGPQDQDHFLNAVVLLDTQLSPLELLDQTQRIELEQGRVRKAERFGPRTLDIDILLFGNQVIEHPRLQVPHYDMHQRAFMLLPLYQLAPQLQLPDGRKLHTLVNTVDCSSITPWFS